MSDASLVQLEDFSKRKSKRDEKKKLKKKLFIWFYDFYKTQSVVLRVSKQAKIGP